MPQTVFALELVIGHDVGVQLLVIDVIECDVDFRVCVGFGVDHVVDGIGQTHAGNIRAWNKENNFGLR